jgi:hypothetical protein
MKRSLVWVIGLGVSACAGSVTTREVDVPVGKSVAYGAPRSTSFWVEAEPELDVLRLRVYRASRARSSSGGARPRKGSCGYGLRRRARDLGRGDGPARVSARLRDRSHPTADGARRSARSQRRAPRARDPALVRALREPAQHRLVRSTLQSGLGAFLGGLRGAQREEASTRLARDLRALDSSKEVLRSASDATVPLFMQLALNAGAVDDRAQDWAYTSVLSAFRARPALCTGSIGRASRATASLRTRPSLCTTCATCKPTRSAGRSPDSALSRRVRLASAALQGRAVVSS